MENIGVSQSPYRPATRVVAPEGSPYKADYYTDGTADDVQIQAAIDALSAGGRVLLHEGNYNIASVVTLADNIAISGQGQDTVLKPAGNVGIFSASDISNWTINSLTIDDSDSNNSTSATAITIDCSFNARVENITINDYYNGFIIQSTVDENNTTRECLFSNIHAFDTRNRGLVLTDDVHDCLFTNILLIGSAGSDNGLTLDGSSGGVGTGNLRGGNQFSNVNIISFGNNGLRLVQWWEAFFSNLIVDTSAQANISLDTCNRCQFVNSWASTSTNGQGIVLSSCTDIQMEVFAWQNKTHGIELSGSDRCQIKGIFLNNGFGDGSPNDDGVRIDNSDNNIIEVIATDTQGTQTQAYGVNVATSTADNNIIKNCQLGDNATGAISDSSVTTIIKDCTGVSAVQEKKVIRMKNTSGGSLAAGDLVTLKAVAAGDEVTTTTSQGDDLVFGMATAAISNNEYGYIQTLGKTTELKVDGTTDIAVGDFIGSFTSAGIGQKAAAGDMSIAVALEAYTTDDSSGVIDALLISPRKI